MRLSIDLPQKVLSGIKSNYKHLRLVIRICLVAVIFMELMPLNPFMPKSDLDLDNSWRFAINEAKEQGMVFGKDIIFPFGPYGSVYTRSYHPATDQLMVSSGFFLAACLSVLILFLTWNSPIIWQLLLIFFIAPGFIMEEALLFLYLLLLCFFTFKIIQPDNKPLDITARLKLYYVLSFFPVGLLLLIKGNLAIMGLLVVVICAVVILFHKQWKLSAGILFSVLFSTILFWLLSGQPFSGLWNYFTNTFFIINGYSEAMARDGSVFEIGVYIIASASILIYYFNYKNINAWPKWFLLLSTALMLFLVFKSSYVRHDWDHGRIGPSFIILVGLFLHLVGRDKFLPVVFMITLLAWAYMHRNYSGLNPFRQEPVYKQFVEGLITRANGQLQPQFTDSIKQIRKEYPLPVLKGNTDIYSYAQTILLATENKWSPRPVIQSYCAYTGELARINELNLKDNEAPDNIVFRVEPIDGRFPSLDDGISWPTIINNYVPVTLNENFLLLKKNRSNNKTPRRDTIYCSNYKLGDEIILPDSTGVLFAEIGLEQNTIGRLIATVYKPQRLIITSRLKNGEQRVNRFVSTMGMPGFIISPYIENNMDFNQLFIQEDDKAKMVKSFKISAEGYGNRINLWKKEFPVCVSRIIFDK